MTDHRGRFVLGVSAVLAGAVCCAGARADWVYLTDGRVGRGAAGGESITVTFPDGSTAEVPPDQVERTATEAAVNREVDRTVRAPGRARAEPYLRLKAAAVPRLLHHLRSKPQPRKMMALFGLLHCWSVQARGPVVAACRAADPSVRKLAMTALRRHEPAEVVAGLLAALLGDANPAVAGAAFDAVERVGPDAARMKTFLADARKWRYLIEHLPRYHDPALIPGVTDMLRRGDAAAKAAAIVSLIHLNAAGAATRSQVARRLRSGRPVVRDRAAEYLTWHGRRGDLPGLTAAAKRELEPYAKAAIEAAIRAIGYRAERGAGPADAPATAPASLPAGAATYAGALAILTRRPGPDARRRAFAMYRRVEPFEPVWKYGATAPDAAEVRRRERKLAVQTALFAIPAGPPPHEAAAPAGADVPPAGRFLPPVRGYFDPKRKSFGKAVPQGRGPFGGCVHVGDDCAWERDHATVVAIAAGVVRQVQTGTNWGGLVIIEHRRPDGRAFCSLYGHLGPFLHVRTGHTVAAGRKIGSLGRACTWANGGYGAHLHFGVHDGPYLRQRNVGDTLSLGRRAETVEAKIVEVRPRTFIVAAPDGRRMAVSRSRWIRGYIRSDLFRKAGHGWLDPQAFLRKHARASAPAP